MAILRSGIASPIGIKQIKSCLTMATIASCFYFNCACAAAAGNSRGHKAATVATTSLPLARLGSTYSGFLSAKGGTPPYNWSLKTGSLPAGLTLNSAGQISGIPNQTQTSSFIVQVQDSSAPNQTASQSLSITVTPGNATAVTPINIATTYLTTGQIGITYNAALAASGGTTPYFWSIASGALPSGLSLSSLTGQITGTPTQSTTASFTVQVTDSSPTPQMTTRALSIAVTAPVTSVNITTSSLPNAQQKTAYSAALAASGGSIPYSWSIGGGTLPAGLTLNSSGQISGIPSASGALSFVAQVQDSSTPHQTALQSLRITVTAGNTTAVTPINIATTYLTTGQIGITYNAALAASGVTTPYFWSIASGALPSGLSLSSLTGQITGTPTQSTTASFTVQVTDSSPTPQMATRALSIAVTAPVTSVNITTSSLPNAQQKTAYSAALAASGGSVPYSWSIGGGTLPAGLTLNSSGQISGIPSASGTFSFVAKVTDSTTPTAQSATMALGITVTAATAPVQIATTSLPAGQVGAAYATTVIASGGTTPYSWGISSGALPPGLTLTSSTGAISGTPTSPGTASFTVQVKDAANNTTTQALSVPIAGVATAAGAPVISPSVPTINQGTSTTFVCVSNCGTGGTWSCVGCAGNIDSSTGVYTAPETVNTQNSQYGVQVLPNNHIFNTNISGAPLRSDSATLIAGAGTVNLNYGGEFPLNAADSSTPTENEIFNYTPQNNGIFQIPAYPFNRIEGGWFSARQYNTFNEDHHMIVIDPQTAMIQEMYQYYPAGANTGCPTCTSQSGQRYSANSYALPNGATDAAGLDLLPLMLRLQEFENACNGGAGGGSINHALRMTLQNGYLHPAFLWPATSSANAGSGVNFYGERVRLKSSFNVSGFSACAQILLNQLKNYGLIIADGGGGWSVDVEQTHWPIALQNYLREVNFGSVAPSNFEVVDESGLMTTSTSGEANTNRETVKYTSSTGTATMEVVLVGPTIGLPNDVMYFQAGSPALQLTAFVGGGSSSVTWSMNPALGTLSTGGLYTPPSASSTLQSTTVIASISSGQSAMMTLWVLPNGTIRLLPGQSSNYTDTHGNVWLAGEGAEGDCFGGIEYPYPCTGYDGGGTFPTTPDITLYRVDSSAGNDYRYDLHVANGTYTINLKASNNSSGGTDNGSFIIEPQGVAGSPIDILSLVGNNEPYDYTTNVNVTTGLLSLVLRRVNTTFISALQIIQTSTN
jgi:hypothetical protein